MALGRHIWTPKECERDLTKGKPKCVTPGRFTFSKASWPPGLISEMVVFARGEHTFRGKYVLRLHGNSVSAGRWAIHLPARQIDECFTRTGSNFLGAAWLAFVLGCPAGLGKGRLQGHQARPACQILCNNPTGWEPGRPVLFPKWVF